MLQEVLAMITKQILHSTVTQGILTGTSALQNTSQGWNQAPEHVAFFLLLFLQQQEVLEVLTAALNLTVVKFQ